MQCFLVIAWRGTVNEIIHAVDDHSFVNRHDLPCQSARHFMMNLVFKLYLEFQILLWNVKAFISDSHSVCSCILRIYSAILSCYVQFAVDANQF